MPVDNLDPNESDGLLGHFIGVVEQSWWSTPLAEAPDDNKPTFDNADQPKEYWHVRVLDILQEDFEGVPPESMTLNWGVGKGWWIEAGGRYLRHNDDPPEEEIQDDDNPAQARNLNASSALGEFMHIATGRSDGYSHQTNYSYTVKDGGGPLEYDLRGLPKYLRDEGLTDIRDAQIFQNLVFEFRGIAKDYHNPGFSVRTNAVPTKFLGHIEDYEGPGSETVTPVEQVGPLTAADVDHWTKLGATPATASALAKLAYSVSSHAEFASNALVIPEVRDTEALSEGVLDEANWS